MKNNQPAIKAVFFDFMGVLLFPKEHYAPDEVVDAIDRVIGRVTDDAEFKRTIQAAYHLDEAAFQGVLARIVDKYEPYAPVWELLPGLRQRCKIAVINNGTYLTFAGFDARLNISGRFDAFISSALEGLRKPDPAIYLRACQLFGVKPHECLFMDDSELNILGAQQVGLRAILWKNREEGIRELVGILNSEGIIR